MPFELTLKKLGTPPGVQLDIQITEKMPRGWLRQCHDNTKGLQEWHAGRIWVERDKDVKAIRSTLLHEVIHAALTAHEILDELNMSPEQEEELVGRLETFLADYFERPEIQALYQLKASK